MSHEISHTTLINMIVTLHFVMNIVAKNCTIKAENVIIMGDKSLIKKRPNEQTVELKF